MTLKDIASREALYGPEADTGRLSCPPLPNLPVAFAMRQRNWRERTFALAPASSPQHGSLMICGHPHLLAAAAAYQASDQSLAVCRAVLHCLWACSVVALVQQCLPHVRMAAMAGLQELACVLPLA